MSSARPASWGEVLLGVVLFLPIPFVLYLFVVQPRPLDRSLAIGVMVMIAHRFVARPYMRRIAERRSLWTGLPTAEPGRVELRLGSSSLVAAVSTHHRERLLRFFAFLQRWRWAIRAGIFLPLLSLLVCLALAANGTPTPLGTITGFFQLAVGTTVAAAAFLWPLERLPREPIVPAVPVHTFFLLGVVPLLWIFRLVGLWWIWKGLSYLFIW